MDVKLIKLIDKEEYSKLEKDLKFVTVISTKPRIVYPNPGTNWVDGIYDRKKNLDDLCDLAVKKGGHYVLEVSCAKYFNECFIHGIQPVPTYNNIDRVYGLVYKQR